MPVIADFGFFVHKSRCEIAEFNRMAIPEGLKQCLKLFPILKN
jgi:hypothetical protein